MHAFSWDHQVVAACTASVAVELCSVRALAAEDEKVWIRLPKFWFSEIGVAGDGGHC